MSGTVQQKRMIASALLAGAVAVGGVVTAPAAHAGNTNNTVGVATQRMTGPTLNSTQHGWWSAGSHLDLICYTRGQSVRGYYSRYVPGGYSNIWYQVSDGHYVADIDINTGSNNPVTPPCGGGTNSVTSFYQATAGRAWPNVNGGYTGECVSLVSQYLNRVHGIRSGAWGNAIDYRAGGSGGAQLAARGFTWRTDRNFRDGDIIVWAGGPYGHVGVWYAGQVYDQNYAGRRSAGLRPFSANGYLGYWRK